jgi:hypothetical protein
MSCSESPIFIYAGATWNKPGFFYEDDETDAVIPLTGLNARGKLRDADGNIVLSLDSGGVSPNLIVDAAAGSVFPNVASDVTPTLLVGNAKRALTLYLELYDASTPPVVEPFGKYDVIALPDEI